MWQWIQSISWPQAIAFFIAGGVTGVIISGIIMGSDRENG